MRQTSDQSIVSSTCRDNSEFILSRRLLEDFRSSTFHYKPILIGLKVCSWGQRLEGTPYQTEQMCKLLCCLLPQCQPTVGLDLQTADIHLCSWSCVLEVAAALDPSMLLGPSAAVPANADAVKAMAKMYQPRPHSWISSTCT